MLSSKAFFLLMRGLGMFLREFRVNFLSLITLATLIFVYHLICTVGTGTASFLSHIAQVNTIRAYLVSGTVNTEKILKDISDIAENAEIKYYSPKDAKEFVIKNAPNIAGMKSFADEFFPAFIEITPQKGSGENVYEKIESAASKIKGVDSVSYGKEFMSRFVMISRASWAFMFVISVLFAVAVSFTIYNTVKLSMYKFKDEIRLTSLVGGTRPFISMPYVFSSVLQAVAAYSSATAIFIIVFNIFNNNVLYQVGINIFKTQSTFYFMAAFIFTCLITVAAAMAGVVSFFKKVSSVNED